MLEIFDQKNEIRAHADFFEQGTPDVDWMSKVASWGQPPIVVAGDGRILKNPAEQKVLRDSNLMFVHLAKGWTNLQWNDWAWKIIRVWPDVVRNVEKLRDPWILEVSINLKVVQRMKTSAMK